MCIVFLDLPYLVKSIWMFTCYYVLNIWPGGWWQFNREIMKLTTHWFWPRVYQSCSTNSQVAWLLSSADSLLPRVTLGFDKFVKTWPLSLIEPFVFCSVVMKWKVLVQPLWKFCTHLPPLIHHSFTCERIPRCLCCLHMGARSVILPAHIFYASILCFQW